MEQVIPGTIVAYGGSEDSLNSLETKGWLLCDGQLYDRTKRQYAALFEAIAAVWGGDGGTKFAVPDLRGQFLRGVSSKSSVDPDKDSRIPSRTDLSAQGNKGNTVGSKQQDSLKEHTHNFPYGSRQVNGDNGDAIQYVGDDSLRTWTTHGTNDSNKRETRPTNAYVYYIIKL